MTANGKERGMMRSINLQYVMLLFLVPDMEWGNDRVPALDIPQRAYIDTILAPASCGGQVCSLGASVDHESSHPLKT